MDPFLAEIRIFGFDFAPARWAHCDGQLIPITQNTSLFSLVGTMYGGDGKSTFALPDLRDSAAIHPDGLNGPFSNVGAQGGTQSVSLLQSEMPAHGHVVNASTGPANVQTPSSDTVLGRANNAAYLDNPGNYVSMAPQALAPAGGDLPHNNMQPYLTTYFNIALQGVYPQRG